MRLIDADVLYERACELEARALSYVGKIVNDETKTEEWRIWSAILAERTAFKHDVFDAPTIEERNTGKWIPCSKRLPEKEGWYITTVESEKTGKRRIENDLFAIDIALAHGLTPNRFCKDGHRQRTVAWCEFPEPWEGKEK